MKSKRVYETLDFKRGEDPKVSLSVGTWEQREAWLKKYIEPTGVEYNMGQWREFHDKIWVYGGLDLNGLTEEMPDGGDLVWDIKGFLNISDSTIKKLPGYLIVEGDLISVDNELREWPRRLEVWGSLVLFNDYISEIPKRWSTYIKGDLKVSKKMFPKKLSKKKLARDYNFYVGGKIYQFDI